MKKSLLALAAFAMMAGSANAMYLIGAPAGEWNPAVGIEMEEVEGGWQWTGYVSPYDYFAFATQLTDDWDTLNNNYRLSPTSDGLAATGVHELHFGTPEGAFHGIGTECTYLVSEVEGEYKLTVTVNGELLTWGLIGDFNSWNEDVALTQVKEGVWSVTMSELTGAFKFRANNSWDVNYGGVGYDAIGYDGDYELEINGNNFVIDDATDVTLTLDLNNMVLTVEGYAEQPPVLKMLALRGSFTDWEWEWGYYFMEGEEPGIYFLYLDFVDSDWEFKIANQDWSEQYTTQNFNMWDGEVYDLTVNDGSSSNMGFAQSYTDVLMTLDLNNNTLSFTGEGQSGINAVEASEGTVQYFNLQGVRINNPEKGMYIRVIDGKSEKIIK